MKQDELLRLACIYAEQDRESYLDAWKDVTDDDAQETKREIRAYLKQLRAYRRKRWGQSQSDILDKCVRVPINELRER